MHLYKHTKKPLPSGVCVAPRVEKPQMFTLNLEISNPSVEVKPMAAIYKTGKNVNIRIQKNSYIDSL